MFSRSFRKTITSHDLKISRVKLLNSEKNNSALLGHFKCSYSERGKYCGYVKNVLEYPYAYF